MKITTENMVLRGFWLALVLAIGLLLAPMAQAQTFTVLHNFTGGMDGANPDAGLTLDRSGNLYGTAAYGGNSGGQCYNLGADTCGTVFRLAHTNSGWIFETLYAFTGPDGNNPHARVVIGPDDNLYGTTTNGGTADEGTVFKVSPPPSICASVFCPWRETVLYSFPGGRDGAWPFLGDLVFDQQGNIYGTTSGDGNLQCDPPNGCGTVFKLTPSPGGWTESILYQGSNEGGGFFFSGVIFDHEGNLYGTAPLGGAYGYGVVYELTPSAGNWVEQVLYNFTPTGGSDGDNPIGGLIFDDAGNLYGGASNSGANGGGTAYELSPFAGNWTFNLLYSFSGQEPGNDGPGPWDTLLMDSAGNLYGTTIADGAYGYGNVFKLTPSNGGWTYSSLHDFTGGEDGASPSGSVILDANGNLYGTASEGGNTRMDCNGFPGCGVVWEITP